jgi:hypothetical protein
VISKRLRRILAAMPVTPSMSTMSSALAATAFVAPLIVRCCFETVGDRKEQCNAGKGVCRLC